MSTWETILAAIGGTTALLLTAGFLVRSLIVHFLDKDVEAYKVKMQADANRQLEAFKTELRLVEFRSTKLHDKRAEAVAEIYRRLANLQYAMNDYIWTFEDEAEQKVSRPEKAKKLDAARNSFFTYFDGNRILLNDGICNKLDDYHRTVLGIFNSYAITFHFGSPEIEVQHDAIKQAFQQMKDHADPIRKDLTKEFRRILRGDDDPGKS